MVSVPGLASRFSPDTINRLELAAVRRYEEGTRLCERKRFLCAVYLYGFSVEMCLAAAYFRSAGFAPNSPIDRDTRERQMKYGGTLCDADNKPLMDAAPHPLVGWCAHATMEVAAFSPTYAGEGQPAERGTEEGRDRLQTLAARDAI